MLRKYRIKEKFRYGKSTFYVQYKFLCFWRTCGYCVEGFDGPYTYKHTFRTLEHAKAFIKIEEKEYFKELEKKRKPRGTRYHDV